MLTDATAAERHPLIQFRRGAAGRREPHLVGTRLLVRQLIATLKGHDGDIDDCAAYLDIASRTVRAAPSQYAEFAEEIDADTACALNVEADERARWEREQVAIA